MTLLPPVSGASGDAMHSVIPQSRCKTPSNVVHYERKPLRDTLRAVSSSSLTLESGIEAANRRNSRGSAGASRVKKTVLLGGLLLLGQMAWRAGAAGIATFRSRYQEEPEGRLIDLYPGTAHVGTCSPYLPPAGYRDSALALLPLAAEPVEHACPRADVNPEVYAQVEVLSDAEHRALADYLRQFQTAKKRHADRAIRARRNTKNAFLPISRINLMYDRAKLPAADKSHVVAILSNKFLRFPLQDIKTRGPAYTWMVLDMLLLGLGEKETPFRLSYQKLGRAARRRLAKFSHISYVKQYLNETPPHFAPRRKTAAAQSLMKKYAQESRQHAIQHSAYWQGNAAGLNRVITDVYKKYYVY